MEPRKGARGVATGHIGISRRDFLVRSTAVAAGTGALVWAAPAIRTVQTGAADGSAGPSPNVAGTTTPEQSRAGTVDPTPSQTTPTSTPETTTPGAAVAPDGASLPLTGGDVVKLAAIGATSVVAGGVMLRAQQRIEGPPPLR